MTDFEGQLREENERLKALLASAYDQLGYSAESGPWRDVYLTAAFELRNGISVTALASPARARP